MEDLEEEEVVVVVLVKEVALMAALVEAVEDEVGGEGGIGRDDSTLMSRCAFTSTTAAADGKPMELRHASNDAFSQLVPRLIVRGQPIPTDRGAQRHCKRIRPEQEHDAVTIC